MAGNDLLTKASRKIFARHIDQYTPEDPLYEFYTDKRGRKKRRRRELPPGLSARDQKILRSVKRRAHYLDKGFSFCGIRFGWSFIIGIVPGVGDAADALLAYFLVIRKSRKADIPAWLTQRMLFHLAVSSSIGLVPIAGDILLTAYRPNSRNAALLEEFLRIRGEEALRKEAEGAAVGGGAIAVEKRGTDAAKEGKSEKGKGTGRNGDPEVVKTTAADVGRGASTTSKRSMFSRKDKSKDVATRPTVDAERSTSTRSGRSWGWGRGNSKDSKREGEGSAQMPGAMPAKRESRFVEEGVSPETKV